MISLREIMFMVLGNCKIIVLSSDSPQVTQLMVQNQYMSDPGLGSKQI